MTRTLFSCSRNLLTVLALAIFCIFVSHSVRSCPSYGTDCTLWLTQSKG
jgi:hypothetical protein